MNAVYIYPADCLDYSTVGLGQLFPTVCTVTEEAAGRYELSMEHPIEDDLRWAQIEPGRILKVCVPVRENPAYEAPLPPTRVDTTVTRSVYRVNTQYDNLRMRTGPGTDYSIISTYPKGTEVVAVNPDGQDSTPDNWRNVTVRNGGATGWMADWYLAATGEKITETFTEYKPGSGGNGVRPQVSREQLFRITKVDRDTEAGIVRATALHIFYDNRWNLLREAYEGKGTSGADVVSHMAARLLNSTPFIFYANDITDKLGEYDYGFKSPVEILLDPDKGVAAQTGAQVIRDNYEVWLIQDSERDMNVTVRRNKNLEGVTVTTDASNVVTRIIPVGRTKEGDDLFLDGTIYVDSPNHFGDYPAPMAKRVDYDVRLVDSDNDKVTTFLGIGPARARLRELALEDFTKNGVDQPEYGMEVDFVLVQYADGFENYADLQSVFLYDTVTVIDELIGLYAKVRVTGYTWNVLLQQYDSVKLGKLTDLRQTVYSYNLPNGGISGSKIAGNSLSGEAIRSASIQYAKIASAAVESLSADAITALTAHINQLTAQNISTDDLSAAYANITHLLTTSALQAESIEAGSLMAALAEMVSVSARLGSFDQATVQHLVASAMNLTFGVGDEVFIENLKVAYAQMVDATIRNLVIRSSEGNYYRLDVSADGTVTATPATVSAAEAEAGRTQGGQPILETDITAQNLSTANLLATYALVNRIDAARIDVDQLFARQAFIDALNTNVIQGNGFIELTVQGEVADAVSEAMAEATPAVLRIDSSRGTVFKNNQVSTVLSAVIYYGSERITDIQELRRLFGNGAYLQWSWQRMDENRFGVISAGDSRIGDGGFTFTLSPADVDMKVTFMCELIIP